MRPMHPDRPTRAGWFEQDFLRYVIARKSIPDILRMVATNWHVDRSSTWATIQFQAATGMLRAAREGEPGVAVDLTKTLFSEIVDDYAVFAEPTEATFARLRDLDSGLS